MAEIIAKKIPVSSLCYKRKAQVGIATTTQQTSANNKKNTATTTNSNKNMSDNKSAAATLLHVAKSYVAADVLEYTSAKKKPGTPSKVIVIDSKMTPLEAATLLWENNM